MNINIRKSIMNNFLNCTEADIEESIIESINDNEEITLPGLGVFFELLWKNSDETIKKNILKNIRKGLN